ncbi:MAG: peptidoglycan DD-metalloendopeptidase family protein [Actinomycetia bacterium]|nr:peptidoglycan DD-metalloendopeptidase family protein [Actinomycetes bacterium]
MIASLFLCGTMLGALAPIQVAYGTDAQEKLTEAAEAGKKAAEGQKQVDALRDEIKGLDEQASQYIKEAAALQPQIDTASEKTEQLTLELRALEEEAEVLRSKIAATAAEYAKQQELVSARMSETYKQGDFFFIELLLSATNIKDLITRYEYVQRTIEANALYARDLETSRRELEVDKTQLDTVVAEAAVVQKEAADAEGNLRTMKATREEAAANAEQIQDQKAALMSDTQANVDALRALQADLYKQAMADLGSLSNIVEWGSGEFSGMMVWPVEAPYNMSCPFGAHDCGYHGSGHEGQDIGTGSGTNTIFAAAAGQIVQAGWNGGYGNFISIDHGNGVVTQYGHLSFIAVSVGQVVAAGQPIGNAGSTGYSFGNHLHFNVVVNGSYVNPMNFF